MNILASILPKSQSQIMDAYSKETLFSNLLNDAVYGESSDPRFPYKGPKLVTDIITAGEISYHIRVDAVISKRTTIHIRHKGEAIATYYQAHSTKKFYARHVAKTGFTKTKIDELINDLCQIDLKRRTPVIQ